jgi:hypothetical protein
MRSPKPVGLQPATVRQVHSTRRDVVDGSAAIVLKRRDLLAWLWDLLAWLREANVHVRSGRFRRCIGWSVLDPLIRQQSRGAKKMLTCLEASRQQRYIHERWPVSKRVNSSRASGDDSTLIERSRDDR